jgi:Predicted nucleotide-binding protein containing TIR-like domain
VKINIFYSWQSWTNQKKNRYFIQKVIEQSLSNLKKDFEFDIECALDRDTKDLPGTPAIADSILEKIDNCKLFICDLTITTKSLNKKGELKSSPNPNVLIELGYAVAKLGWEKVITVMNIEYGDPKKLPFDLQHRRFPIAYNLPSACDNNHFAIERKKLSGIIESSIKTSLARILQESALHPKDERVLEELEQILFHWHIYLTSFVASMKLQSNNNPLNLIEVAVKDKNISFFKNPSNDFIKSIVVLFSSQNLEKISPHFGGKDTWIVNAADALKMVMDDCSFLLQRYADRDEIIISLVEAVHRSSRQLAGLLEMEGGYTAISNVWSYGLEEFLLSFLQSYGIILEHKGIIEVYDDSDTEDDYYKYL